MIMRTLFALLLLTWTGSARLTGYKKRNFDTISRIYDRTRYPNNLAFLANGSASVPPGLFNEKAQGRITPVGNFSGFDDSTEYFFALAPIPVPPMYSIFSDVRVVEFTSGCPSVASSVVYFTTTVHNPNATNDGQYLTTSKQVAFWEFDRRGAVIKYDAWIPNLRLYANIVAGRGSIVDPLPPAAQAAAIQGLCRTAQSLCKGNNTVYDGLDDCIKILTAKPFGDGDNLWADTVNCRQVHLLLARIRPDTHCPHVGPTGGGKCVDVQFEDGYLDDQVLFGQPQGQNFVCPN
ncbi:MAG: hypothetical protein L6R40_004629 [Gallowayella cf. fulva]|nr:MAG: hypothetical protein L6R40_004629 [Xanthomendoza cf. fulva]